MGELFDKEVNAQKESLKKLQGFTQNSPCKPHEKVCDENERNKQTNKKKKTHVRVKNVIDGRKHYIGRLQKTGEKDRDKLRVNDYGHNEGTHLFSKRVNVCQGDGFSSVGARTGAIKLAMAVIQDWWRRFPPLLGC